MTLREQIYDDMETLFFDPEEGSVEIIFNGTPLTVNPITSLKNNAGFENSPEQGVLQERRTYDFREIDLDPPPVPWEEVEIDGKDWTVLEVLPMSGAIRITFFRERA